MDKRDPVCGTSGSIRAHGHYFCSQACIVNYEKQGCVKHCIGCNIWEHKPWYKRGLYIFGLITIFLMIISYSVPQLNGVYNALVEYIGLIWWAILLGLLIGGAIDYFVPKEYISTFLSTHRKSSIFYAVGLGFIMSACCHGILAISIELYKKGASIPSIVAFLLASPWANLPVTILLFGFFGVKALYIVVSAVVIAIITGFIFQVLDKKGKIEKNPHVVRLPKKFSIREDFKKRLRNHKFSFDDVKGILKGAWALAGVVVWWILLGMILAAFVRAFVPSEFFVKYLGATLLGLIITLIFATIIEVCSEGSSVLSFEIFKQTGAFGNAFTFLMAGVVTDFTEIGLLWSNIGKKTALWLIAITLPQVVVLGYLFNVFL